MDDWIIDDFEMLQKEIENAQNEENEEGKI